MSIFYQDPTLSPPKLKSAEIREHIFVYFLVSFVLAWSKEIGRGWKVRIKIEGDGREGKII